MRLHAELQQSEADSNWSAASEWHWCGEDEEEDESDCSSGEASYSKVLVQFSEDECCCLSISTVGPIDFYCSVSPLVPTWLRQYERSTPIYSFSSRPF